ncbi:prephenate dehydratase [Nodularia spumigena CS-584]|uniref:Prephenate dehydratase n=1 Tax=Nodularia spumigena UHCC 0060 TaxID=3110300 RepID=A0ABU5USJ9_NODSP|nr:prephenate dehydratase [Nodularia spumigena]AHJ27406.1 Prephenate dehydratase [Nodularia spumigena CCY9414]EAW45393.1 prephenate dehydratase [Nodularia spumigena CCY9414]MDB9318756.1 prephenate dehydratase [Nodularia spumigena CS-590/01A]MDB9324182.1 prephenate dehydratase [Nodularia spumigena CS-591/07A]MDB9325607.1 prephenate dehydratase [Nodularia spumigena CS-590/02]
MTISIAHLGPPGTYAEQATVFYANWLAQKTGNKAMLCPYSSIAQSLEAVAAGETQLAVVPVENSIEGSVTMTMDTLWRLDSLRIQLALVMPIAHALISSATSLDGIQTVYSHPQALAQCQGWLGQFLPTVQLIPSNSTTVALQGLDQDLTAAAIASSRAAQLYNLPILASNINDYPENCTRFWVVSQSQDEAFDDMASVDASHTSLAFSVPANLPGSLLKPLQVFAQLGINLSRIESRPTKRSLGEYLFFIDLEADVKQAQMQSALAQLSTYTEILKIFGSYHVLPITIEP